jgi:hypothetical protein
MSETRVLKVYECQKKAQITQERVEYKVFLFDELPKGSKSLKIFKISLTFHFDKLSNLSKSVHTGENSQFLTVSNKKLKSIQFASNFIFRRTWPLSLGHVIHNSRTQKIYVLLILFLSKLRCPKKNVKNVFFFSIRKCYCKKVVDTQLTIN